MMEGLRSPQLSDFQARMMDESLHFPLLYDACHYAEMGTSALNYELQKSTTGNITKALLISISSWLS